MLCTSVVLVRWLSKTGGCWCTEPTVGGSEERDHESLDRVQQREPMGANRQTKALQVLGILFFLALTLGLFLLSPDLIHPKMPLRTIWSAGGLQVSRSQQQW